MNEPGDVQKTSRRVCRSHWAGSKEPDSNEKKNNQKDFKREEDLKIGKFSIGADRTEKG